MNDKGYIITMTMIGISIITLSMVMGLQTYLHRNLGMMFFIPSILLNVVGMVFGLMLLVPVLGMIKEGNE